MQKGEPNEEERVTKLEKKKRSSVCREGREKESLSARKREIFQRERESVCFKMFNTIDIEIFSHFNQIFNTSKLA